jgi:hypothetical protein
MIGHKNYNLNVNEDFVMFLTFKLITSFIEGFIFGMKSQWIAYVLIVIAYLCWILDLEDEVYLIWNLSTNALQDCKNHVVVEVERGGQQFSIIFKRISK